MCGKKTRILFITLTYIDPKAEPTGTEFSCPICIIEYQLTCRNSEIDKRFKYLQKLRIQVVEEEYDVGSGKV
jgi:hypothetical protein